MSEAEDTPSSDSPAIRHGDVVSQESPQVKFGAASWAGPLPPPGALRSFEEVVPGSAERILAMAEKQMEHRILVERKIISGDYIQSYLGIAAGFLLSVMIILGGIYLIIQGHDWAGGILIGLDLVGLATVFVLGSSSRRGARRETLERIPESDRQDD